LQKYVENSNLRHVRQMCLLLSGYSYVKDVISIAQIFRPIFARGVRFDFVLSFRRTCIVAFVARQDTVIKFHSDITKRRIESLLYKHMSVYEKFPDLVDNEINNNYKNNKQSLRSNTKSYGGKTH
jgi:hypothetical protein